MRSRCSGILLVITLTAAGLMANVAHAQTTGDIEGTVSDSNNAPLPGASVEAKSPSLQGSRTNVTDAAGRFRFPAVPPGVYTVVASLTGFTKVEKNNVRVPLGGTVSLPMTLSVSVKEEIVVTGEAPAVDTTKNAIGGNASLETIQRLPLGRNFTSIADTVAGTGSDVVGLTVYGATGLENAYIIDGVNTTGGKTGTQSKNLNNEFIQEIEVRTGGYEAEYGRVLGGMINVITKSGGNEFHGDGFGYYDSSSLAANDSNTAARQDVKQGRYFTPKRFDFGADVGGYFIKDRLWFFGAYDRVNQDQDFDQPLQTLRDANKTVLFYSGSNTTRNNLYSGKLTFRLGESNTVAASIFGDPGTYTGVMFAYRSSIRYIGPASAMEGTRDSGGPDLSLKYDGVFGTQFLVQAQYGYHQDKNDESSPFQNSPYIEIRQPGYNRQAIPGSGPIQLFNETFRRNVYKAAGTLFMGTHEIKGGVDWEHLNSTYFGQYGGTDRIEQRLRADGSYRYSTHRYYAKTPIGSNCLQLLDPTKPYSISNCNGYAVAPGVSNAPSTDNLAFFAQDTFKVFRNLTLNVGVRYETQKLKDFSGATKIDIKNEWSPRIGVVWDFLNNGRSKLYGSYGRFYEVIPQDIQTRSLGNEYIIFARNPTNNKVDPINTLSFPYAYVQGGDLLPPGLKGMYQDEVVGGLEYEIARGWAIGVKGIYKALGRVVEDRCDLAVNPDIAQYFVSPDQTCALINPGDGTGLGTIKDPTDKTCYPNGDTDADGNLVAGKPCNSTLARRYFRGIEFTANHRISNNFYVLASYLYSRLEGNYSGNLSQTREFGQADPNINADFDYPGLVINSNGILKNDRTHQVKLSGFYAFPFGLSAGLSAFYTSGKPYSIRGCTPDLIACQGGYDQEGYLVPRGSAGRLPGVYEANLHLEYKLNLGNVSIVPVVDVFNLLNRQGVVSREELFNNDGSLTGNDPKNQIGSVANPQCTAAVAASGYDNRCATNPNFGKDIAWQTPRVIRVGARISF